MNTIFPCLFSMIVKYRIFGFEYWKDDELVKKKE